MFNVGLWIPDIEVRWSTVIFFIQPQTNCIFIYWFIYFDQIERVLGPESSWTQSSSIKSHIFFNSSSICYHHNSISMFFLRGNVVYYIIFKIVEHIKICKYIYIIFLYMCTFHFAERWTTNFSNSQVNSLLLWANISCAVGSCIFTKNRVAGFPLLLFIYQADHNAHQIYSTSMC